MSNPAYKVHANAASKERQAHIQTLKALERLMDAALTAGLPRESPAYQGALRVLASEEDR